jgi:hypothetical protein
MFSFLFAQFVGHEPGTDLVNILYATRPFPKAEARAPPVSRRQRVCRLFGARL